MVASSITVISRKYGEDKAWKWVSDGADGYTIEETEKATPGTDVIMTLKADTEDEKYSEYLEEYEIRSLIRKYSDYIRYPIRMEVTKSRPVEEPKDENAEGEENKAPKYESYTEMETLNSMVPIWQRDKKDVTEEEYETFYRDKFFDYNKPLRTIHYNVEGNVSFKALLYIPGKAPYDFYTKDYEKGLALYASGVLIMEKCGDLLPDYFSFVKGIVDSQDLSLNISREMLQKDNQLKLIHNALEKKIKNELHAMLTNDREKYEAFWKEFGRQIKFGAYSDYGMHGELLRDLLTPAADLIGSFHFIPELRGSGNYTYRLMVAEIEACYNERLSVARIAKSVNCSESYINHIFKKKSGMSVSAYINTVRVRHAKELLTSADEPVSAVAFAVGYSDANYFSDVFRKIVGMTPTAYRNMYRRRKHDD